MTTQPLSADRDVVVHLFGWTWRAVAAAAPRLAGIGYGGVQISPPQEHVLLAGHPWYQDYQPVSYQLVSRRGDEADFVAMIEACHAAGIRVYADAVINHMTGVPAATGYAGTQVTRYDYPGLYGPDDFHHCGLTPDDSIQDYQDRAQVQDCELLHLADLRTESDRVRDRLAGYLNRLLALGVDGFRVDAAKHIPATDVAAIWARLDRPADTYLEVIDYGNEPIRMSEYVGIGRVTDFPYGVRLGHAVQFGRLADLRGLAGAVAGPDAQVFVDNHDTQRHGGPDVLTHVKPTDYRLANIIMLGWDYGTPVVMSSYDPPADSPISAFDMGPPASGPRGTTKDTVCGADGWVCEHAWPQIAAMVGFHNAVRGTRVTNWWDNGDQLIAWSRGDRGYVVVNNGDAVPGRWWETAGMPAGRYRDVLAEQGPGEEGSTGAALTVNDSGWFQADIPARCAVAIHVGARLPDNPPA